MKSHGYFTRLAVVAALVINLSITPTLFAAAQTRVVPRGTVLKLILDDRLSTKDTEVGDMFKATVAEDVNVSGRTLIRHGDVVEGTVTQVEEAKRLAGLTGKAGLTLRFDSLRTDRGESPLTATLISVHDPVKGLTAEDVENDDNRDLGDEGQIEAERDVKGILTKGAIGVAAGALLGALFGNVSRGVLLGSIGGAVAILAPKGEDVELKEGTGLQIRLDRDLNLSLT